jgi:hypothetical protein
VFAEGPQQLCGNPGIQLFKLLRRHVVTVTVNPDRVIEGFNVLENQSVRMIVTLDTEPVQPFPLDERMKRFNTGIVIGIPFMTITELELFRGLSVSL